MIKIHDKIWYVIKPGHEDELAYMCQYEETKEGNPSANVAKMQSTGRSWARTGEQNVYKMEEDSTWKHFKDEQGRSVIDHVIPAKEGFEHVLENTPTTGFYVGSSVSRWSTSNKLFRVKDPRDFTVEIPTDNLATLLHHTTVVKGVVQEACVWGREGNNHILLPINSEPYLITLDQMDTLENKLISVKDLKPGDWVRMFEDDEEYYYAGKMKGTWKLTGENFEHGYYRDSRTYKSDPVEIKDDKWTDVFLYKYTYQTGDTWYTTSFTKPKIVEVVKNEKLNLSTEQYSWYCPVRVKNRSGLSDWYRVHAELIDIEFKK